MAYRGVVGVSAAVVSLEENNEDSEQLAEMT